MPSRLPTRRLERRRVQQFVQWVGGTGVWLRHGLESRIGHGVSVLCWL